MYFMTEKEAQAHVDSLKAHGLDKAAFYPIVCHDGKTRYRVCY